MKIVSTNIGERKTVDWKGKSLETGIYKYPTEKAIFLGKSDVLDDHVIDRKYHGGIDKACYAYSLDHYNFWKSLYPEVDMTYGAFGENLTIENLAESQLRIGDQLKIGTDVIVEISQPRQPCMKLGIRFNDQRVVKRFVKEPFSGIYLRVLNEGWVKTDDQVTVLNICKNNLTVKEVHMLLGGNRNEDLARKAILMPELASSCREDLIRIYGL
ncbi:MAG: MOSC domain-containing protein [Flavobacteriales bacterium]|nr:MOSC domain-containing protein [Flavobacteriales bacterium]